MARRCLDCGALCGHSRCTSCQRAKDRRRNADRPLAKALTTAATHCERCGCELDHANPQSAAGPTAQHTVAFADGGTLAADAPVICRSCNSSLGRG